MGKHQSIDILHVLKGSYFQIGAINQRVGNILANI
jgi:hypothetical protein